MDFSLSEEQTLIQDTARNFANEELAPIAAELDATGNHALMLPKLKQLAQTLMPPGAKVFLHFWWRPTHRGSLWARLSQS